MDAGSRTMFERLAPVSDRYATLPVADAFTWAECLPDVRPGEWYMVAFRSIRRPNADEARLTAFDDRAHTEAMQAIGFVHYLKGPTNARGECLSFCLWTSRAKARAAARRPAHLEAAALTFESYARYNLEFHRVRRFARGGFTFEPYDRGVTSDQSDVAPLATTPPMTPVVIQPAPS